MPFLFWINGREQAHIAANDRGLHYGDGLFETLLYLDGKAVLEKEHLARLQRDVRRLHLNLDRQKLTAELGSFLKTLKTKGFSQGIIKILVTRQFSGRGYAPDEKAGSNRLLQFFSGMTYPKANREGINITLLPDRLSINPELAGIKHLNRLEQVLAQHFGALLTTKVCCWTNNKR
jgi:4-amino-4-deoxychorismate lyase